MDNSGPELNHISGGVIRWEGAENSQVAVPLAEQLRQRAGAWAVIGQNVTADNLSSPLTPWAQLNDVADIEVECRPVDDGEFGVLYDIYACCTQGDSAAAEGDR